MNKSNSENQIPLGKGNNITIEGYDNEDMSIFDDGVTDNAGEVLINNYSKIQD